jgi:hypothetical protein
MPDKLFDEPGVSQKMLGITGESFHKGSTSLIIADVLLSTSQNFFRHWRTV